MGIFADRDSRSAWSVPCSPSSTTNGPRDVATFGLDVLARSRMILVIGEASPTEATTSTTEPTHPEGACVAITPPVELAGTGHGRDNDLALLAIGGGIDWWTNTPNPAPWPGDLLEDGTTGTRQEARTPNTEPGQPPFQQSLSKDHRETTTPRDLNVSSIGS